MNLSTESLVLLSRLKGVLKKKKKTQDFNCILRACKSLEIPWEDFAMYQSLTDGGNLNWLAFD